jgi:hypothetical protein
VCTHVAAERDELTVVTLPQLSEESLEPSPTVLGYGRVPAHLLRLGGAFGHSPAASRLNGEVRREVRHSDSRCQWLVLSPHAPSPSSPARLVRALDVADVCATQDFTHGVTSVVLSSTGSEAILTPTVV